MARLLYCTQCRIGYASVAGDVPKVCPCCDQPTVWTTMAPVSDVPRTPWELNVNDRRFLRALHIAADA